MTRPTIYWDESSRGYHGNQGRTPYTRGRWVGEKMQNGKRIRMRSTDYNKVLAWVSGEPKGIKLKGYPNYYVNVERREIYGRGGKPIRSTKVNAREMYGLTQDGKRFSTQWNRIAYAAINGIDVRKIPQDLSVEYRDGQYVLEYLGDVLSHLWEQRRSDNFAKIENSLNKRKREIDILLRYYSTHDVSELVTYATKDCFDSVVRSVINNRYCSVERARDIVLDATEQFLRRVTQENVPVVSISHTIRGLCAQGLKKDHKNMEYNDNVKTTNNND